MVDEPANKNDKFPVTPHVVEQLSTTLSQILRAGYSDLTVRKETYEIFDWCVGLRDMLIKFEFITESEVIQSSLVENSLKMEESIVDADADVVRKQEVKTKLLELLHPMFGSVNDAETRKKIEKIVYEYFNGLYSYQVVCDGEPVVDQPARRPIRVICDERINTPDIIDSGSIAIQVDDTLYYFVPKDFEI